jgi:hypothetical protein
MDVIFAGRGHSDQAPGIDPVGVRAGGDPHTVKLPRQGFWPAALRIRMKRIAGLILVMSLAGCSVCKSSDSPEVCRTKERDHSQPHADFAVMRFTAFQAALAVNGLR